MRAIDADALSAFVGDLRSALHKEQTRFRAMTDIEFNTRDYMLLHFQYVIDNAPTVEAYTEEQVKELVELNRKLSVERQHGEWIVQRLQNGFDDVYCPFCKARPRLSDYGYYLKDNFCPKCGADLRVKDELRGRE